MEIAIIGGGSLGLSLGRALLLKEICSSAELLIVEHQESQREKLRAEVGCEITSKIDANVKQKETVIVAVKPQDAGLVCPSLAPYLNPSALIISPMAGITLRALQDHFGENRAVVRCMPNLAAEIGLAMTVYCASDGTNEDDLRKSAQILSSFGSVLRVTDERLIDAATALSGSGPAYFFYLIENLIAAGKEIGFSTEQSECLVAQTMRGALELWQRKGISPREIRMAVTSPNGTTAAAVAIFEKHGLGQVLKDGVQAALSRSHELSLFSGTTPDSKGPLISPVTSENNIDN